MVEAALAGHGVALAPAALFERRARRGRSRPRSSLGGYWLTRLKSKRPTPAMEAFESWILPSAPTEYLSFQQKLDDTLCRQELVRFQLSLE